MMIVKARKGQVNYGESIGILLLDSYLPFIPGDVGNATTYSFPVRYKTVEGFTVDRLYDKNMSMLSSFVAAGQELVRDGVKAITGDCGYMALYQKEMANQLDVPVFMSSLLQIPFITNMLRAGEKVGVLCADSTILDDGLLQSVGVTPSMPIIVRGLQDQENFYKTVIEEVGTLDVEAAEKEVVSVATEMVRHDPQIKVLLLECSVLPPYAEAVQKETGLPVFDYITMINYVHSALVKRPYDGFM